LPRGFSPLRPLTGARFPQAEAKGGEPGAGSDGGGAEGRRGGRE